MGGDDAGERKSQWSEDMNASGAMEPKDLVEKTRSASRQGGDRGSMRMDATKEDALGNSGSGTLTIKDQDTGREFVMSKKEASALLTTHHSGRQVVQDGSTGAKLTVDEFGSRAGLPARAPAVAVQTRGGSRKSFNALHRIQTLRSQEGTIWTMSFNINGTYLAAAGQDRVVRVWKSLGTTARRGEKLFEENPIQEYAGHRGDILELCWSHTDWLLSSSMDKTVRLWYTTMSECLRIFTHQDFVTSICFNPVNDKFFISGSLDGKLRMWNIPDLKVVDWVDVGEMVTSCMYAPDGKRAVVGTHKGKCLSYGMDGHKFEYLHDIQVKNSRSAKVVARKITGIDFRPNNVENMLVTVNDSRLRVYDSSGRLDCKYKGHSNQNAQIRASYSSNGRFIVSGSEQPDVYVWRADTAKTAQCGCGGSGVAKQSSYEKFSTSERHVTVALFAPDDIRTARAFPVEELTEAKGQIIVAAGYSGQISVYENI